MIEAIHLSKQYGKNIALYDANFSIGEREVIGFLGPNGAGKSTAMNLICGYLEPTWGQVKVAGFDMAQNPLEAKRHIGYLPEIAPLYMDMTVTEQLSFTCQLRGLPYKKAAQKDYITQLCHKTQLLDVRDRLIRNLSKGYRQRVAVAQLLIGEPEILVLDEPTVGLDPRQIQEFRELITELGQTHTIILSSHILSEIRSVCRRVFIFDNGELIADGEPDRLQEKLSGRRVTLAEITGDVEHIVSLLTALPQVLSVKPEHILGQTHLRYRISHQPETDIRAAVYETLKTTDSTLLMLAPQEISLESLYLQITQEREKI